MAVNYTDFDKVWASASPLTPYEFSDNNYRQGGNFVGATPPSRQMWDAFMKNADEKLKYLYDHEDIPVGHEYFTMNPNIPQGSLPLLGGEYSRETYSALWTWVQQQTGYLKTEAEWQALSLSNNGNVPYYSDGDGSTTFRVPSLHCWIKGSDGSAQLVGSYLQAGLPNITGLLQVGGAIFNITGGAIEYYDTPNTNTYGETSSAVNTNREVSIDASRSSSIYGNANTVQPESIVGMWLVKAYGTIVDTGTIDEQAYIDDRMNAMTQYVNNSIGAINTRLGTVLSAYGTSTVVNTEGDLCSISTHDAGVWLIIGFVDLNYAGTANFYINKIYTANHGSRSVRTTPVAGGGSINIMLTMLNENELVSLKGYQNESGTMLGTLQMVQLA